VRRIYALANPGNEYLVRQPGEAAEPFTVELAAGEAVPPLQPSPPGGGLPRPGSEISEVNSFMV
jgi:hypothetical protein